jgi:hypothetical protein
MDSVRPPARPDAPRLTGIQAPRPARPPSADGQTAAASRPAAETDRVRPAAGAVHTGIMAEASTVAPSERVLPAALLTKAEWRDAEWAWRRLCGEMSGGAEAAEAAVRELWKAFTDLSDVLLVPQQLPAGRIRAWLPQHALSGDGVGQEFGSVPVLIEGRHVPGHDAAKLPAAVRRAVEADRWMGSVAGAADQRVGLGWWVLLPLSAPADRGGDPLVPAVPWRAKRMTREEGGRRTHVLYLEVGFGDGVVTLQIVARTPQLWVHVTSSDPLWCNRIEEQVPALTAALAKCGWQLVRLTTTDRDVDHALGEGEGIW